MSIVSSFSLKSSTYTDASKNNTLDANREFLLKFISSDLLNNLDRFAESDKFHSSLYEPREFFISQKSPFQRNSDVVEEIVQRYLEKGNLFNLFIAIASNRDPGYLSALEKMFSSNAFQNASLDLNQNQKSDWLTCIEIIVDDGDLSIQNKLKVFDLIFNHHGILIFETSIRLELLDKILVDVFCENEKSKINIFVMLLESMAMKNISISVFINSIFFGPIFFALMYDSSTSRQFCDRFLNLFDYKKKGDRGGFESFKKNIHDALEIIDHIDSSENPTQLSCLWKKAEELETKFMDFIEKNYVFFELKDENFLLEKGDEQVFQLLQAKKKFKGLSFGAIEKNETLKKEFLDLFRLSFQSKLDLLDLNECFQ